jgi:hypothetical protein
VEWGLRVRFLFPGAIGWVVEGGGGARKEINGRGMW